MNDSRDEDEATRLAAPHGLSPERAETDVTRVAADARPTADATRVAERSSAASPASVSVTRSEGDWSHPERWNETHDQPIGPGSTIKARFVLEELIGHGGMGAVYRARDLRKEEARDRDPYVALKLLNDDFRGHPDALMALQREARKSQTLAHPNIVTVYDFDRDGSNVFLSMELLRGRPLDAVIRERGGTGLPLKEALPLIQGVARGLAYAHERGFAHADFKPGNIFVNEDGTAKVLDFGIARAAKVARDADGDDETLFDPATLGAITLAYASPEMLRGEAAEPADDVYALGCVAYELLTGNHPFRDETGRKLPADQAAQQGMQPAPIPRVPKRVDRTLRRALAFRREDRFADAGAFLNAIKEPVRLRRTILAAIAVLAIATLASWWITIRNSDILVTLADLPPQVAESVTLIRAGDGQMQAGEFAEAHKDFSQAWQIAKGRTDLSPATLKQLRVVINRRVNDVIGQYLKQAQQPNLEPFQAEVLRMSLEALLREDLGSRDDELRAALTQLDARLDAGSQP